MKLTQLFLEELETEAAGTRRALERVPEGRPDWKPHEKSMPLGYLASLCATMPGWIDLMINKDEWDIQLSNDGKFKPVAWSTREDLLRMFDESLAKGRAALENTTEEHLMKNWRFLVGGHVATDLPRYVMIRDSVFNHLAHHRGQLTVYLRLNEAMVPAIYGPSADERYF